MRNEGAISEELRASASPMPDLHRRRGCRLPRPGATGGGRDPEGDLSPARGIRPLRRAHEPGRGSAGPPFYERCVRMADGGRVEPRGAAAVAGVPGSGRAWAWVWGDYRGGWGQPLVLIHWVAADWRVWKPVLGALTAERDVLAPASSRVTTRPSRSRPAWRPRSVRWRTRSSVRSTRLASRRPILSATGLGAGSRSSWRAAAARAQSSRSARAVAGLSQRVSSSDGTSSSPTRPSAGSTGRRCSWPAFAAAAGRCCAISSPDRGGWNRRRPATGLTAFARCASLRRHLRGQRHTPGRPQQRRGARGDSLSRPDRVRQPGPGHFPPPSGLLPRPHHQTPAWSSCPASVMCR